MDSINWFVPAISKHIPLRCICRKKNLLEPFKTDFLTTILSILMFSKTNCFLIHIFKKYITAQQTPKGWKQFFWIDASSDVPPMTASQLVRQSPRMEKKSARGLVSKCLCTLLLMMYWNAKYKCNGYAWGMKLNKRVPCSVRYYKLDISVLSPIWKS